MSALRRHYGHGAGHLAAMLVCYGFAAYAIASIFANAQPWTVLMWLAGGIVVHEFVVFPLYTSAAWLLARAMGARPDRPERVRLLQHIVTPVALSGLLLVTWLPLILRLSEGNYRPTTGMTQEPYLWRWLAVTVALIVISAIWHRVRSRRAASSTPSAGPAGLS